MRFGCSLAICFALLSCSEIKKDEPQLLVNELHEPLVGHHWKKILPGGDTACADGRPFQFWAKRGNSDKLLVYFLGGGACWDAKSCNKLFPYYRFHTSKPYPSGIFDMNNPENPFWDWNVVYISYCSADTHWGNNIYRYPKSGLNGEVEIQHKGFVNAMAAVRWTFDNFENPSQIFLAGDSAGGYGSTLFAPYLMEHYAASSFVHFSDSAVGVSTSEFVTGILETWNVTPNIHASLESVIERAENDPQSLTTAFCYESVAKKFPQHKFVQLNTVQDETQKFFFQSIGGNPDEWRDRMEANISRWEETLPNFAAYTAPGDHHVLTLGNEFYRYQVNGWRLRDFVNDLALGKEVESVHCVDCEEPELFEIGNPAATNEGTIVQPYQDPGFEAILQGSAQCGPGSLFTVWHYYGAENIYTNETCENIIDLREDLSEPNPLTGTRGVTADTHFCQWVNGGKTTGTSWKQMKYAIKDLRYNCERPFAVELVETKTDLESPKGIHERKQRLEDIYQRYLLKKRPVIIHLSRSPWLSGHYLVLIGYDQEKKAVYYADPNDAKIGVESLDAFLEDKWYRSPRKPDDYNLAYWDGSWMAFYPTDPELAREHDSAYDFIFDEYEIKKGLIVNGDDFGLNANVNQGIRDAFENGILSSTSVQAPTPLSGEAFEYAAAHDSELGVGIHLTLSRPGFAPFGPLTGKSQTSDLVEKDGFFPTSIIPTLFKAWNPKVRQQIVDELSAQIDAAKAYGLDITHLDCHDAWCHVFNDYLDDVYLDLGDKRGVPVRWRYSNGENLRDHGLIAVDMLIAPPIGHTIDDYEKRKQSIINELKKLERGQVAELVLHPQAGDVYEKQAFRVLDYRLAFDGQFQDFLAEQEISLVSYRILRDIQKRLREQNKPVE